MKINTRIFGEIEVAEEKVIYFAEGMIGFPECKNFTLIYDDEKKEKKGICWLQNIEEPGFALPVMDPLIIKEDYNPVIGEEWLSFLGNLTHENMLVLVTVTVPQNLENLSVNLKAPIVINAEERKGCQIVVEDDFPVKYKIYQILKDRKAGE